MILNENQINLKSESIFLNEGIRDFFRSVPVRFKKKRDIVISAVNNKIKDLRNKILKEDVFLSEGLFSKTPTHNDEINKILKDINNIERNLKSKNLIISKMDSDEGSTALYVARHITDEIINDGLYATLLTFKNSKTNEEHCTIFTQFVEGNDSKIYPLYSAIITHKVKNNEVEVYLHYVWKNSFVDSKDFEIGSNVFLASGRKK